MAMNYLNVADTYGRGVADKQSREINALNMKRAETQTKREEQQYSAEAQRRNTEMMVAGIDQILQNPAAAPEVANAWVQNGVADANKIGPLLQKFQANPQAGMQELQKVRAGLAASLGQSPPQPKETNDIANYRFARQSGFEGSFEDFMKSGGSAPAGVTEFNTMTQNMSPEEVDKARRIALGLAPRAVGSSSITIASGGLTDEVAESESTIAGRKKFAEATGSSRAKMIDSGFEKIEGINSNIRNIDKAITAIDQGASTGVIESKWFPSFRESTLKLEQVQKELGLDVIGAVTFGALSKGELDLALDTALPTGLQPPELRQFLVEKKAAQEKLGKYYMEQIDFLDQGGTPAQFLRRMNREKQPGQSGADDFQSKWDAAPSGAVLQAPDGTMRRKP